MAQDLKAIARRTLEEILPNGDVAGLRAVMHPEVVNHEPRPARRRGWTA
jgi:hypothetical protein